MEAVRIVRAIEKKDTNARGAEQDFAVGDEVYILVERNQTGQRTKAQSVDGSLSVKRGSEGRVSELPAAGAPGGKDAVVVDFFGQGKGLFLRKELARVEGVEIDQAGLQVVTEALESLQREHGTEEGLEVAIVAVMGKFRHGKSFLLNLLASYFEWLEAHPQPRSAPEGGKAASWWGPDRPVPQHFRVQRQAETCTKGIQILPRPFLLRRAGGRAVAALLMDSQGTFDGVINERQSQTILALSSVLASNVIYNFKGNLGEENLSHAMDIANFVRSALGCGADNKPCLGRWAFMLRDFDYPYVDGQRDQDVSWEVRRQTAKDDLNRFDDEVAQLNHTFASVDVSWLCHPGDRIEQHDTSQPKMSSIKELYMQLLDEFVWHTFESDQAQFPSPSRVIFDGVVPLTVKNFSAYLEDLRKVLFDCDLNMAPPRWMATQLMRKTQAEFTVHLDQMQMVKLPVIQHHATSGFGGYYTSSVDDFYSISKVVQIGSDIIATSEKCPGNPMTGTAKGDVISMLGGQGVLAGDDIHWKNMDSVWCFSLFVAPIPPQVWSRQALTREQVAEAEAELQGQAKGVRDAEADVLLLRRLTEGVLATHVDKYGVSMRQALQTSRGELERFQDELRASLTEVLEAKFARIAMQIAQKEVELAQQREDLTGQRARIAVLESKMLKAELQRLEHGDDAFWPNQPQGRPQKLSWAQTMEYLRCCAGHPDEAELLRD